MKNTLQEFCQKRSLDLPKYETTKIAGPSHLPEFISKVTVFYSNVKYSVKGTISGNKKAAELSAASMMLSKLDIVKKSQIKKYNSDSEILIYIDMENIHIGDFFDHKQFGDKINFIGVATENHPSIKHGVEKLGIENLVIETIKSDRRDAADMLIVWLAAKNYGIDVIVIVTKDHFGSGLVDIINSKYGCGKRGFKFNTLEELNNWLEQFIKK